MCSSTWSMQTRSGLIRESSLSMSRIIRVPLYLSSRCGVWIRISSLVFTARSRCSWKMVASLRVFLFRPISPMPRTFGLVEELGDHRDDLARQGDVLGLLGVDAQPAVDARCRTAAARFGSNSVSWRK